MKMVSSLLLGFLLLSGYGTAMDGDQWIRYSAISPKGDQIAFVSDRQGNPHIFILDILSGQVRRLTLNGKSVKVIFSPFCSMFVM